MFAEYCKKLELKTTPSLANGKISKYPRIFHKTYLTLHVLCHIEHLYKFSFKGIYIKNKQLSNLVFLIISNHLLLKL